MFENGADGMSSHACTVHMFKNACTDTFFDLIFDDHPWPARHVLHEKMKVSVTINISPHFGLGTGSGLLFISEL